MVDFIERAEKHLDELTVEWKKFREIMDNKLGRLKYDIDRIKEVK